MKTFHLCDNIISDEGFEEMCGELASLLSQIESFDLWGSNIGGNGCVTLGNMLSSWRAPNLKELRLGDNSIDDIGLRTLVKGMINCCNLEVVKLSGNRSITAAGLRSLSTLFQSRSCSLKRLSLKEMNIGDDGAAALAEGLAGNNSLKQLHFDVDVAGITEVGWSAFSKLLCDTSTTNSTYLSNHTLECIGEDDNLSTPKNVEVHLDINCEQSKNNNIGAWKIIRHHRNLDMEPLFQWKLKFLPLLVTWFERVRSSIEPLVEDSILEDLEKRKLSAVHKFVHGMPLLIIYGYNNRRTNTRMSKKRRLDGEAK
jgi:hypothetical protein